MKGEARAVAFHGGMAGANIAAALPFGRRRGQQQLLGAEAPQEALVPSARQSMSHDTCDLCLMHRVDHRRGGTSAAEPPAYIGDVRDAHRFPAEIAWGHDAHQTLLACASDRFLGKARRS